MKVDSATPFVGVCLLLAFSVVLHGCDDTIGNEPAAEKSTATCRGKKMDCKGARKWCAEQTKRCSAAEKSAPAPRRPDCHPECTWECEAQKCHQNCAPKCQAPVCATRCQKERADSCKMQCGQRECSVVCPKDFCPHLDCPQCKTVCGKPVCKMQCADEALDCRHVCADPVCKWDCSAPQTCPPPKCHMKCEKSRGCAANDEQVAKLPALKKGEIEVMDAAASASLVQVSSATTLRVNMTSMGQDLVLKTRQVELSLAQEEASEDATVTWTRTLSNHAGQMVESEASCTNGHFQCQGDAAWCAGQEKILCDGSQVAFLQHNSRNKILTHYLRDMQAHLRA